MATCFISDLHLDRERPDIAEQFVVFLAGEARNADALYILGDLFEAWIGDDDDDPYTLQVQQTLCELTQSGVPGYFMHGNRDFMIGDDFARNTGFELLPDPTIIELYGHSLLLSHGDKYCTDDTDYQTFRRQSRDPVWQQKMLALPLSERRRIAAQLRTESLSSTAGKPMEIMDVNRDAIGAALREAGVTRILHGHTHRPAVHRFSIDGTQALRIVLGDWYEQASILRWDQTGFFLDVAKR